MQWSVHDNSTKDKAPWASPASYLGLMDSHEFENRM